MSVLQEFKAAIERSKKEHVPLLQTRLEELNTEIDKGEEEIAQVKAKVQKKRDERNGILSELRKIDPELAPSLYADRKPSTNGKKKKHGSSSPSPDMLQRLQGWLEQHRAELTAMDGFRAVDLYERDDWDGVIASKSAVNKSLSILREEGYLKVDRFLQGKPYPGKPTGKFYKFV